jgi:hypothetical protein
MSVEVEPVQLEYASAKAFVRPEHHRLFKVMFWLSVLSGCCVWACFFSLANPRNFAIPHLCVFSFTICLAVSSEAALSAATGPRESPARMNKLVDLLILGALGGIGVAPCLSPQDGITADEQIAWVMLLLGVCFAVLAAGSLRHAPTYDRIAYLCRNAELPELARKVASLGAFKSMYEMPWLGSCALMASSIGLAALTNYGGFLFVGLFFALPALLLTLGFLGLWIRMLILHYILMKLPVAESESRESDLGFD